MSVDTSPGEIIQAVRKRGRPFGSKTQRSCVLPLKPILATEPIMRSPRPPQKAARPHQPVESSKLNSWTEAEDKVLRTAWKSARSIYVTAKRIGKPAPEIVRRAKELKLGERPRPKRKRNCVKCQEPFVPEDWTTDWYCDKHKRQRAQMTEDLTMQVNALGRARV